MAAAKVQLLVVAFTYCVVDMLPLIDCIVDCVIIASALYLQKQLPSRSVRRERAVGGADAAVTRHC